MQENLNKIQPDCYKPTRYSDELFGCPLCKHEVTPEMETCEYCGARLDWRKKDSKLP